MVRHMLHPRATLTMNNIMNVQNVQNNSPRTPSLNQLVELRNNLKEYIELTKDLLGITDAAPPPVAAPAAAKPAAEAASAASSNDLAIGEYISVRYRRR